MIILGIDPGSRRTGFGIIREIPAKTKSYELLDSGVFRFDKIPDFLDRVPVFQSSIEEIMNKWNPDCVVLESLIFKKSPTALIKLAQARGIFLGVLCKTHQGRIFEYSPNLIKTTITGHGHATKENVQRMVSFLLKKKEFKTDDESDALAVAICHGLLGGKSNSLQGVGMKTKGRGMAHSVRHAIKG